MKSEPDEFSIDDFERRELEEWTGVRNYQARNFLRAMQLGDQFFLYHSSCDEPGIVGIGEIVRLAVPDPTQFDSASDYFDERSSAANPRWSSVLCKFVRRLHSNIKLDTLRANAEKLDNFTLLAKGTRLSVIPVHPKQWQQILKLESQS